MTTKRSEIIFTLVSVVIDLMMIFLAFLAAYWLRSQTELIQVVYLWPIQDYLRLVLYTLPFWALIFLIAGLYAPQQLRAHWGSFSKVFMAISAGIMFFVVWVFLSRTLFFSRLIVVYAWVLAIIFVFLGRLLIGGIQRLLYRYGVGVHNVMIVGESETAETLKEELENNRGHGYRVVNGLVKPTLDAIKQFLEHNHRVDEIIVADSEQSANEILDIIALAEEHSIAFRLIPNLFEVKSTNVEIETLAAIPIIAYRRTPLGGWQNVIKRLIDLVVSGLALLLLSPIFVIISLLIKADTRGPVYYKHKRLGMNKREFSLYKFRTMKLEYCTGDEFSGKTDNQIFNQEFHSPQLAKEFQKLQKLKDDPRVTRFGRLLRRTSLDELPQLFNVFFGQLSMVGPRPIVQNELPKYGAYKHRLFVVKPGATGLWQVSGRSDMPYRERVKLDMYYIENWSLWQDIVIMVKTFFVILFRRNAY